MILGTLILLIRPKLVSPDLPLPDLLLQIAFIVVTTALFIWKFGSIRFLVLALLTEDVYTLIALLVRNCLAYSQGLLYRMAPEKSTGDLFLRLGAAALADQQGDEGNARRRRLQEKCNRDIPPLRRKGGKAR